MWDPTTWYGGAKELTLSGNYSIVDRTNRVFCFNPSADAWIVTLPDAQKYAKGAQQHVLLNLHATRTIVVKDNGGNTLVTLAGREAATLALRDNSTAAGTWAVRVSTGI